MTPQELAQASADAMWERDHATRNLGMALRHIAPGEATLEMTVTQEMANGQGNAHGGYIFALADSAFAFACNTYNQITVAQHCAVSYHWPGAVGDVLTAVAREVTRSGRSGLYDVAITRADGRLIASFRGHSRIVRGTHLAP